MTIIEARKIFKRFVISYNALAQRSGMYLETGFPSVCLPASKEEITEALELLIKEDEENKRNYEKGIKLLKVFI